jgi:hypothetical protein
MITVKGFRARADFPNRQGTAPHLSGCGRGDYPPDRTILSSNRIILSRINHSNHPDTGDASARDINPRHRAPVHIAAHIVRGNEASTSQSSECRSLLPNDFGLIRVTKASQTRNLFRIAVLPNLVRMPPG